LFLYCPLKDKICPFSGKSGGVMYCGLATGENRISFLKVCPYKKKKRRR